jgi:hypothetical protein
MDLEALRNVLMPHMMQHSMKQLESMRAGQQPDALELDKDKINAKLAQLPQKPDEHLR